MSEDNNSIYCNLEIKKNGEVISNCSLNKEDIKNKPQKGLGKFFSYTFIMLFTSILGWALMWSLVDYITEIFLPSTIYTYEEQLVYKIPILASLFVLVLLFLYFFQKKIGKRPEDFI